MSLIVCVFDYVKGYDYGFEDKVMYSVQYSNIRFKWFSNILVMVIGVFVIIIVLFLQCFIYIDLLYIESYWIEVVFLGYVIEG